MKTVSVESPIEEVLADDPQFLAEAKALRARSSGRKAASKANTMLVAGARAHHFRASLRERARAGSTTKRPSNRSKVALGRVELVQAVAGRTELPKAVASRAVAAVFDSISDALREDGRVSLVGFGTFSVSHRAAAEGRNPRTGAKIKIAASKRTTFKAGRRLRDTLN